MSLYKADIVDFFSFLCLITWCMSVLILFFSAFDFYLLLKGNIWFFVLDDTRLCSHACCCVFVCCWFWAGDCGHMAALGHNPQSLIYVSKLFWSDFGKQQVMFYNPCQRSKHPVTPIQTNWVRAADLIWSDAVWCSGDPFQLCLRTQSPRARKREQEREGERRAAGPIFFSK